MFTQKKLNEVINLANMYLLQSRDTLSKYTIETVEELKAQDIARCGQACLSSTHNKRLGGVIIQLSSILDNHMRIYRYGLPCRPKGTASYHYTTADFMDGLVECGIISKRQAARLGF